jgi:hypothetical protein
MAKIAISELRPAGVDLFAGSESFMHELTDTEMDYTNGGGGGFCIGWSFLAVHWC